MHKLHCTISTLGLRHIMKPFFVSAFGALVSAFIVLVADAATDGACVRRSSNVTTSLEFTHVGCRDVILLFVRGTHEPGNMVSRRSI